MIQSELLTPRDVAQIAGFVCAETIKRAYRRGDLKGFKLNSRAIRFRRRDVDAWIKRMDQ